MSEQAEFNIELTQAAEKFIRRMMRFAAGPEAVFRLKVTPGGCSGYAVEFDLAESPGANEVVWERAGLRLSFDHGTCLLLNGGKVDFIESLSHAGFVVTTPGKSAECCSPASNLVSVELLTGKMMSR
jgi:iron-sulfur cluster assembly accessory protein